MGPGERLLLVLVAAAFAPVVVELARVWWSVEYYSHGFLVPMVAGWIALRLRREAPDVPVAPDARGWWVIACAALAYLVGLAGSLLTLQGAALVLAVAGVILRLGGPGALRTLAFPVAYLLFMVPLPAAWITPVVVALQLAVSTAAVAILHWRGLPVAREGNVILLPGDQSLFVAEACSGITSMITLVPLAVFLGYFVLATLRGRVWLALAVVPLALLANLVRVVATVLAALAWGAGAATGGTLHESAGLATFVASCLLLLAAAAGLRRWETPARPLGVTDPG
jgi:exosortase